MGCKENCGFFEIGSSDLVSADFDDFSTWVESKDSENMDWDKYSQTEIGDMFMKDTNTVYWDIYKSEND